MTTADERREQVLEALMDGADNGVSGQRLADALGCSRAAVHRHVEALRRSGVAIDGAHDGYVLAPGADPVSPRIAARHLHAPLAGPVEWGEETDSTNEDLVVEARSGAGEGRVIGTDHQRRGRGRRGRSWRTNPGDALLFSVLLRPQVAVSQAGFVPIVVAVGVADALGDDVGIIWPNDLVRDGRKLCGILCELGADEGGVAWVVAGIGINVRPAPPLDETRWQPGSLSDGGTPPPSRQRLLEEVLHHVGSRYQQWRDHGPAALLEAFAARDALRGHGITLAVGDTTHAGVADGVDDHGHLVLRTAHGAESFAAGEVTHVLKRPT